MPKYVTYRVAPRDERYSYHPHTPDKIDINRLQREISLFFRRDSREIKAMWEVYKEFYQKKRYADILRECKSLCLEEAFIIYLAAAFYSPKNIIEIGTQYGESTRRLIDIKNLLRSDAKAITFDIVNKVRHFAPEEAGFILKDVTRTFRKDVLSTYKPGLIYLDARPYYLLKNVIRDCLSASKWVLAIHDCGRGLCNPHMRLAKEDANVTSLTGVWERYVLAEAFGIKNPLSEELDYIETASHRMKIFSTTHGLALVLPNGAAKE